jgi:hypothetical protein
VDNFENNIIDSAYEEMLDWSGLDTGFIHDILNAAEEDDVALQLVLQWLNTESPVQKKLQERYMSEFLMMGSFIK